MLKPSTQANLQVHIGVLLLGATALFARVIPLSALQITLCRSIVAATALFLFLRILKRSVKTSSGKERHLVFACGGLLAFHWVTYFQAVKVSGIALGLTFLFTFPIITVFLEPIFVKAKIRSADAFLGLLAAVGVCVSVSGGDVASASALGGLYGITSALLYALRNVLYRAYLSQGDSIVMMFYQTTVASIVLIPFSLQEGLPVSGVEGMQLILLGVVFTALPHTLFVAAMRQFSAKRVSIIGCLQPIYGIALGAILLSEVPSTHAIIGGALVVASAFSESARGSSS